MSDDLADNIEQAAQEPQVVQADGVRVEAVPIRDKIAADQYTKQQTAVSKNHLGLTFRSLTPEF